MECAIYLHLTQLCQAHVETLTALAPAVLEKDLFWSDQRKIWSVCAVLPDRDNITQGNS